MKLASGLFSCWFFLRNNNTAVNLQTRAGLKPMRLHWAPRLTRPLAMVVEQIVYFARYSLRRKIVERLINLIVSK